MLMKRLRKTRRLTEFTWQVIYYHQGQGYDKGKDEGRFQTTNLVAGRNTDACEASPVGVSSQDVCPATRVPMQRQEDSGKGKEEFGIDNIGDPNKSERFEEARAAEVISDPGGTWDREAVTWVLLRGADSGANVRFQSYHLCSSPPSGCSLRAGVMATVQEDGVLKSTTGTFSFTSPALALGN